MNERTNDKAATLKHEYTMNMPIKQLVCYIGHSYEKPFVVKYMDDVHDIIVTLYRAPSTRPSSLIQIGEMISSSFFTLAFHIFPNSNVDRVVESQMPDGGISVCSMTLKLFHVNNRKPLDVTMMAFQYTTTLFCISNYYS